MNAEMIETLESINEERLCEAYVQMNKFEWDELLCGERPENWNEMNNRDRWANPIFKNVFLWLRYHLSDEQKRHYWWTLGLGRSEESWRKHYIKIFEED